MQVRRVYDTSTSISRNCAKKVTKMGNITEITSFQKRPLGPVIKKISKDEFVDNRTGEVRHYQHIDNRAGSTRSIRHTMALIRGIVNANVVDAHCCRWITLTYRDNMRDTIQLYKDYEKFWKRFVYWCKRNNHGKPEYITVIEPQARGAWHIHCIYIWDSDAPYIPNNDVLEKLWTHGYTSCKQPTDCDNLGAYFTAYLADLPMDEVEVSKSNEKSKKYIKGGRLHLYPTGMNIIRRSRGIKSPESYWVSESEDIEKEKASVGALTYSCTYEIVGDDGKVVNTVRKEYYNKIRQKSIENCEVCRDEDKKVCSGDAGGSVSANHSRWSSSTMQGGSG